MDHQLDYSNHEPTYLHVGGSVGNIVYIYHGQTNFVLVIFYFCFFGWKDSILFINVERADT